MNHGTIATITKEITISTSPETITTNLETITMGQETIIMARKIRDMSLNRDKSIEAITTRRVK